MSLTWADEGGRTGDRHPHDVVVDSSAFLCSYPDYISEQLERTTQHWMERGGLLRRALITD